MRDHDRVERIRRGLQRVQLDAILCTLPDYVLLLSGYWPVVGASIAIATSEGRICLIVPEDEMELARSGWPMTSRPSGPGAWTSCSPLVKPHFKPYRRVQRNWASRMPA